MGRYLELFMALRNGASRESTLKEFHSETRRLLARKVHPSDFSNNDVEGRNAATLAKWILAARPNEVHVRRMQREIRLPGLRKADEIKKAADLLVKAKWLRAPVIGFGAQSKVTYAVNPRLWRNVDG
jgi:hypothetical protein